MTSHQTISVRLTPKASYNRIGEMRLLPGGGEQLMIYVATVPEGGKANETMIRLLAKHFKVAASRLTIVKGRNARSKTVNIIK